MRDAPIRIAVVGLGNRAIWAVQAIVSSPRFHLVALVDPVETRVELMRRELAKAHLPGFSSMEACLAGAQLDAVAILTPDGTHLEVAAPALRAGVKVFLEKPLEISEDRLARLVQLDEEAGGRTFVGFNLRYAPVYRSLRRLVDDGVLGRLLTIQADEFYDGGRTYFRRWNRFTAAGGGLWVTKACHDFDLLYWFAAAAPLRIHADSRLNYYLPLPEAAMHCRDCRLAADCPDRYDRYVPRDSLTHRLNEAAELGGGPRPDLCLYNSDKDTFDHGIAHVSFANDVLATYTVNVVSGFSNRRMRLSGTKATVDADLMSGEVIIRHRDPGRLEQYQVATDALHGGADNDVLPAFADFVRGTSRGGVVAPAEAAVAVRMGLAARRSCEERRVIELATPDAPTAMACIGRRA